MNQTPLLSAKIDNKVKHYWLVLTLIICVCGIISIFVIPLIVPIVLFAVHKHLQALSVELFHRKLVVKRGIFTKIEKSVPLEKITDISMVQGSLMRAFGLYRLNVETAGQSGVGALVSVLGIIEANTFREKVIAQKDAITGQVASAESDISQDDLLLQSVQNIEALLQKLLAKQNDA